MRRGHTLIELTLVVLLMAMAGVTLLPAAHRLQDRMAVVGAREAAAGLFAEARVDALLLGSSVVRVRSGPWRMWVEEGGAPCRSVDFEKEFSVALSLGRGRTESDLRYDALGIGQVASATLTFRRGGAEAGLVVSAYGRVRRR